MINESVAITVDSNNQNTPATPADSAATGEEPPVTPLVASDELSKFMVTAPIEIAHHLRKLIASGTMATVFSNQGKTFILTRLLGVDSKAGKLIFDASADREMNRKMLASERNVMVFTPEGVKTQFITGQAKEGVWDNRPAYIVPLPTELVKLQRREFFRIQTPLTSPLMGHLYDFDHGKGLTLPLFDLSLGGVALVTPSELKGLDLGLVFSDCALDLKQHGVVPAVLEIRNHLQVRQKNGTIQHRVGCAFVNFSAGGQNVLNRFIAQLERERRAMMRE